MESRERTLSLSCDGTLAPFYPMTPPKFTFLFISEVCRVVPLLLNCPW